ncbi:MAG: hypothetical protein AAGD38_03855 [Acidobacteriota bacterium]
MSRISVRTTLLSVLLLAASTSAAFSASPPCRPCAGILVDNPTNLGDTLRAAPALGDESRLYVAYTTPLDGSADRTAFDAIRTAGGTPWAILDFTTPAPLRDNLASFETELRNAAELAGAAGDRAHFQISWRFTDQAPPSELAFLLKRAAVAITGARSDARVLVGPMAADATRIRALYDEDVAAYVDGVVIPPVEATALTSTLSVLAELDPGKPLVVAGIDWPTSPTEVLARSAELAEAGVAVAVFDRPQPTTEDLAPLKVLANEFQGDLSFDPYSVPTADEGIRAWPFVRGADLALRVIVETGRSDATAPADEVTFTDSQLRRPSLLDLTNGETSPAFGQRRTASGGLAVPIEDGRPVSVIMLDRATAAELEGIEEEVTVADERQMPVAEILRRLQANEDAQSRRLRHYQARYTQNLRFPIGVSANSVEATLAGPFFFVQGEGFDWAWEDLFINGVEWRYGELPEIPLIQPEKASVLPLEINFTKEYSYRLRGTDTLDNGRDAWVIDFEPLDPQPGLYQGTVWVDRDLFVRLQTRAVQVELQGEVLSNEETMYFTPVGDDGRATEFRRDAFYLPTRMVGEQLLSLLNATVVVERESLLSNIQINGNDFETSRDQAYASESTMVRDTEDGLRYLERQEDGTRIVQTEFDTDRLFLVGGVFYDESLEFPAPIAGVNYLNFNVDGEGRQLNVFFGGVLLTSNFAEPSLFGSDWDAGARAFGLFIPTSEEIFRDGEEILDEEITRVRGSLAFFLGRPLGNFAKLDFTYGLRYDLYDDADDTSPSFVLPEDGLTQSFEIELQYNRGGYRLIAEGSYNARSDWQPWGLPGNPEYDPDQEDYFLWSFEAGKTWYLPKFQKFGASVEYVDGQDLDRFSKYDFNFFGDPSVAGYQGGLVKAEQAYGVHLTYGFEIGSVVQFELRGDALWANDDFNQLEDELLAGVSLNGTTVGPWGTLVNFDLGFPLEGPADGWVAYIAFLKLFDYELSDLFGRD